MSWERYRWLAGAIAAHKGRCVVGRTRLQKTIRLLQRVGFPTDYSYKNYFYGPYSEDLQADIGLLEQFGLIEEESHENQDATPYYILQASENAVLPETERFQPRIDTLSDADPVVLELAATYDAFRQVGCDHEEATHRLRQKKGPKCDDGRDGKALELLKELGLPTD